MPRRTVTLHVELPTHLAELLTERGGDIVTLLQLLCGAAGQRYIQTGITRTKAEREQDHEERMARLRSIGRRAYRRFRQLAATIPSDVKGADRTKRRKEIIAEIASELGEPFEVVDLTLGRQRKAVTRRLTRRRKYYVLTRTLLGWTNEEMAEEIGLHRNSIAKIVGALREDARSRGITLFELEREYLTGRVE